MSDAAVPWATKQPNNDWPVYCASQLGVVTTVSVSVTLVIVYVAVSGMMGGVTVDRPKCIGNISRI